MNRALTLLALVALLVGCPPAENPLPYYAPRDGGGLPLFDQDAEPVPDVPERAACQRMCDHLQQLGCKLGQPTLQRKEPCLSWCTRIQRKHEIDVHPDCIAKVPTCARVEDCDK